MMHKESNVHEMLAFPKELQAYPQWTHVSENKAPFDFTTRKEHYRWNTVGAQLEYDVMLANLHSPGVAGAAFVFMESDPFIAIDLDSPDKVYKTAIDRGLPEDAALANKHNANMLRAHILETFKDAYIERSQSGAGYHIVMRGTLPENAMRVTMCRDATGVEMYRAGQYIWLTGKPVRDHVHNMDVDQNQIDTLVQYLWSHWGKNLVTDIASAREVTTAGGRRTDLTDEQVLGIIASKTYGVRGIGSRRLLDLYTGAFGPGTSDNFVLLLGEVDKITGDPDQVYRIVMRSPMMLNAGMSASNEDRYKRASKRFNVELGRTRLQNTQLLEASASNIAFGKQIAEALSAALIREKEEMLEERRKAPPPPPPPSIKSTPYSMSGTKSLDMILSDDAVDVSKLNTTPRVQFVPPPAGSRTRRLYDAILGMMHYPNTTIAWVTTFTVLAAIGQRTIYVDGGLGTSQFFCVLSGTSEGKQTFARALGLVRQILTEKGPEYLPLASSMGGDFSHASAVADSLEDFPIYTVIAEEGAYFFNINGRDPNKSGAANFLLKVRAQNGIHDFASGERYAKGGARGKNRPNIMSPSVTVAADSQPATLYPLLQSGQLTSGMLNRWFIADASRDSKGLRNTDATGEFPAQVREEIIAFAARCAGFHAIESVCANHKMLHLTPEARKLTDAYEYNYLLGHAASVDSIEKDIFGRSLVATKSLAGLMAAYERPDGKDVNAVEVRVALEAIHTERSDLLHMYRSGQVGQGDPTRCAYMKDRILKSFQQTRFKGVGTLMRRDWVIPYYWFTDACRHDMFKSDMGINLLERTIGIMVSKGALEPINDADRELYGHKKGAAWRVVDFDIL